MGKPSHQRKSPEADQLPLQQPEMGSSLKDFTVGWAWEALSQSQLGNSLTELAGTEESILRRGLPRGTADLRACIWCSLQKSYLVKSKNGDNMHSLRASCPSCPSSLSVSFREPQELGWHLSGPRLVELYHGMLTRPWGKVDCWEGPSNTKAVPDHCHTLPSTWLAHSSLCLLLQHDLAATCLMNGQVLLQANPSKSRILLPQAKPNTVADAFPGSEPPQPDSVSLTAS